MQPCSSTAEDAVAQFLDEMLSRNTSRATAALETVVGALNIMFEVDTARLNYKTSPVAIDCPSLVHYNLSKVYWLSMFC